MQGYQLIVFSFALIWLGAMANGKSVPIFRVVSSRSYLQPPLIEVTFPNGFQDEFVLEHYKPFKDSKGGHNYIGYLKKTPDSSVAVTGNLAEPEDRMEITLISHHVKDKIFEVDYFGKTTAIPIPTELMKKNFLEVNPKEEGNQNGNFAVRDDDEGEQPGHWSTKDPALDIYLARVDQMPTKLKLVMKIGYTDGVVKQLREQNQPEWQIFIEKVLTHAQASFYDRRALGTKIQIEVQDGFLFSPRRYVQISDAQEATLDAKLKGVDITSWFNPLTDEVYLGQASSHGDLCKSNAVNINSNYGDNLTYVAWTGAVLVHETAHNLGAGHITYDGYGGINNPCIFESWPNPTLVGSSCSRKDFEHYYAVKFWGLGCLEDISTECSKDTCKNGGTCTKTKEEGFKCSCPTGITGERCEINPDGCKGRDECCTSENKCGEWDGNCNSDSDCKDDLICGENNCPTKWGYDWDFEDNCCFKPDKEIKATCEGWQPDSLPRDLPKIAKVHCGGHYADNCTDCPRGKGEEWCGGDCIWSKNECVKSVSCGWHSARSCSDCTQGHDSSWCNGDCMWSKNECVTKVTPVNCGGHSASSCSDCPEGHGASWCNGDCVWSNDKCINAEGII